MNYFYKIIRDNKFLILTIFIVGFSVYAFNFDNPLFWDDEDWIVNNPFVHSFSNIGDLFTKDVLGGIGLKSNYYRPVLLLTFLTNYVISGIQPLSYHLVSNLLHISNGILIFILLTSLFKKRMIGFIAGLLFVIHPLQTEAVTYISGRGDPLNVFFMLLSMFFFLSNKSRDRIWSLLFMVLAILSRETAVMLPFYLLVLNITFLSTNYFWGSVKESIKKIIPYFGITAIYSGLRLTVLNFENTLNFYDSSNVYTESIFVRFYTFLTTLPVYLKLIFVPVDLHMERDHLIQSSFFSLSVFLTFLGLILLAWIIIRFYQSGNKIWFFAWSIFFLNLVLSSGIFVPINSFIYEHWLYFGLFGFFTLAAFYINKLLDIVREKRALRLIILVVLVGYLGFFGVVSAKRNLAWSDPESFYLDILKYSPNSIRINNNLGNIYNSEDNLNLAEEYYLRAIESEDSFPQPHYNIGVIRMSEGDFEAAKLEFIKSIELDPNFYYAYQNLAVIQAQEGEYTEASETLEKLLIIRPNDPAVYYNLALVYIARNNKERAKELLIQGLNIASPDAREVLERLLTTLD